MRARPTAAMLLVCLCCAAGLVAQTTNQSAATNVNVTQALTTLENAISALGGRSSVSDVMLTGTGEWIAGSTDESGPATYKAVLSANRLDMSLSSGTRSEIRNSSTDEPTGAWISADGVSHVMVWHNLMTDPGWFPLLALANSSSSPGTVVAYFGLETRNGASVIHLSTYQQSSIGGAVDIALLRRLTQVDIYLDPASFLPTSFVFNMHPDDNELIDIPTEIRYFNYQSFGGVQIPLHVQKFVNNSLIVDLHFQSAVVNSGLSGTSVGLS